MHADAAAMPAERPSAGARKRRRRSPVLARIDRRTRTARRAAEIERDLIKAMGGPAEMTPVLKANVLRAAELMAIAEHARATALRSGGTVVDLEALTKVESTADRALRRLPVKAGGKPASARNDLAAYLASKTTRTTP